jgi:hypothetical protein
LPDREDLPKYLSFVEKASVLKGWIFPAQGDKKTRFLKKNPCPRAEDLLPAISRPD